MLRKYSAFVVVVSCALLVSATNAASSKGSGSLLFGYWDSQAQASVGGSGKIDGQINKKNDLALVPLAKANTAVDPNAQDDQAAQTIIQGQSIASATMTASPMKDPEQDGGVKMYTVQQGDTISSIASKNSISVNTIMWANDLSNVDQIKPGDTLFILPVSGIQYKVKSGDSIDSIASKYKADKSRIIAFNDLPANGDLEVGKEITIPDGQGETSQNTQNNSASQAAPSQSTTPDNTGGLQRRQYANAATGGTPQVAGITGSDHDDGKAGSGHRFPYGYCTWYVSQKRYVPWSGNAGTWLYHAKAEGYATGRSPKAGAIMVTTENRYYGHVAYVESVSGGSVVVSEMNYAGFGKVDRRTLSLSDPAIKGFIY
ncbi:MAG TPA: LysM peptidoglycan-binding domain-containing protein [Patescibacteria group bacterium]